MSSPLRGLVYGDDTQTDAWNLSNGRTVILMDSQSASYQCQPNGPINCDIDGDGINDIVDTHNRGWLNLDGDDGTMEEMVHWVLIGVHYLADLITTIMAVMLQS